MKEQPPPGDTEASPRLAALIRDLAPPPGADQPAPAPWLSGKTGRLVERWLPGGVRGVEGVRSLAGRHRFGVAVVLIALMVAICTAVVLSARQPVAESAPALPAAISAGPARSTTTTSSAPTSLVVSVVGRVARPGLVTLPDGARVADAILASGGAIPGTNDLALNLARRLADGEQIYVGIPVPPEAEADPEAAEAAPDDPTAPTDGKAALNGDPAAKVDINTATDEQLQTLPGVGPTMSQHILAWRTQHGHFDSISQLQDVQGIGDGRYAKIKNLVTT